MLATRIARLLRLDPALRNRDRGPREFLISRFMRLIGTARTQRTWQQAVVAWGRARAASERSNFLVLGAARTGSTLLVDYLNCHPLIRCRSEILNPDYELYGDPRAMSHERLRLHVEAHFARPPRVVAGAKILTYQLDELDLSLQDVLDVLCGPAVIVLYRRHVIEQFVSLKIAERSGRWHSTGHVNDDSIRLEPEEFAAFAEREHRMWRTNIAALAETRVHYLSYERLCANPASAMCGVFDFLELKPAAFRSAFVKLNPRPLSERLVNYQEFVRLGLLDFTRLRLPLEAGFSAARVA
jgi:LPS sulfotransferase NodH